MNLVIEKQSELKHIAQIVSRSFKIYVKKGLRRFTRDIELDIIACHLNGCPLRLKDLANTDDFNLMHDVSGICVHLDRKTGRLKNNFRPRFAKGGKPEQIAIWNSKLEKYAEG